jgi:ABC-type dipeptide/oligopeptide/nickel transport system permease subunit
MTFKTVLGIPPLASATSSLSLKGAPCSLTEGPHIGGIHVTRPALRRRGLFGDRPERRDVHSLLSWVSGCPLLVWISATFMPHCWTLHRACIGYRGGVAGSLIMRIEDELQSIPILPILEVLEEFGERYLATCSFLIFFLVGTQGRSDPGPLPQRVLLRKNSAPKGPVPGTILYDTFFLKQCR